MIYRSSTIRRHQTGQALIVLLFYMVIAVTLVTTAVALTVSSSFNTMQEEEGNHALELAENGVENALLRLLRDTTYSGETVSIGGDSVTSTVSGQSTKTIVSTGTRGTYQKTLRVTATFTNGVLNVISWQEI